MLKTVPVLISAFVTNKRPQPRLIAIHVVAAETRTLRIFDERNVLKTEDAKRAKQNSVDANVIVAKVKDQTKSDRQCFDGNENSGQRFKSVKNYINNFQFVGLITLIFRQYCQLFNLTVY